MPARHARSRCALVLALLLALPLAVLLAVAGCGGGEREGSFQPRRLLVFGDEASLITSTGAKYTVNAINSDGSLACGSNRLWVQVLADQYGFVFPQCNPSGGTTTAAIYATANAKVEDIATQVALHTTTSGFVSTDLVTVFAGTQDILALYADSSASGADGAVAAARAAGSALAGQVNSLAQASARVLVVTLPPLGSSPYALDSTTTDGGRPALLKRMVDAFNAGLRATLINDGRMIGLVLLDERVQLTINYPSSYGYSDVSSAACTTALPGCTTSTLVDGATSSSHLWADATRLNAAMQATLGSLAVTRAANNPF